MPQAQSRRAPAELKSLPIHVLACRLTAIEYLTGFHFVASLVSGRRVGRKHGTHYWFGVREWTNHVLTAPYSQQG